MPKPTDNLDELVRLTAIQLRLQIGNQNDAIVEMNKAGIGPSRIAELLGTTAGTVNVAIARAKKGGRRKTK